MVIFPKFRQNFVNKNGPLFIVNGVVLYEAQLTQEALSNQPAFCWSVYANLHDQLNVKYVCDILASQNIPNCLDFYYNNWILSVKIH